MSTVVSVRVPKRLRREIQRLKDVDWSALLKSAIEERLKRETLKTMWKDIEDLRAKIFPSPDPDFSTRSIRQDRGR
jgi:predicted metal-dependent peptidase